MCKVTITDTICGLPTAALRKPTPSELAGLFCKMTDDEQAEFFVAVHEIGQGWDHQWQQWYELGRHLGECEGACGAGMIIDEIHNGLHSRD